MRPQANLPMRPLAADMWSCIAGLGGPERKARAGPLRPPRPSPRLQKLPDHNRSPAYEVDIRAAAWRFFRFLGSSEAGASFWRQSAVDELMHW